MKLIHGFIAEGPFYDDAHFPRGFSKSGNFTIAESELLTQVGKRLFMLEQGFSKPKNGVEEQFVQFCKAQHEGALEGQNKVELLWQKYKKLTKFQPFHSLNGHTSN
ncbi:DUF413 domain-containing protein [Litorilituus lipolyticus]|uniref:Macrodomain Ori protein n=1 Tax=Litorilituus lipolyticus TaxID=2491017 RepID=A0A502KKL3_9GAMM|nr:DUF413 domain-containing protein [Litorilituus lipolyticus]TPH12108.1 DUF413 domain-containing protein [Litorilituus lipolyticus]